MKTPPFFSFPLLAVFVCGVSLCFTGCREKTGDRSVTVETPEAADLELQLEIEREMLAVERELLDLERAQLEEARNTAVTAADAAKAEAEAARAEADQARQALANGNNVQAPREFVPPLSIPGGERPRTVYNGGPNGGSGYPAGNYQPVPSNQTYPGQDPGPDYSLFYEELRPHGAWFETPHYGFVWRPDVARRSSDWRPYTEGRWADTDMGWTWISDEPFGWATYHYGRWTIVENLGWIWVPGSDWAPAWVSWRENNDYIGWAPLPPVTLYETRFDYGQRTDLVCGIPAYHYNFIPLIRFVEPVRRYCLPPVQNVQFVQYTTNVTYIHILNQNIIVNGPRPEPLRTRFGNDRMPRLTLNRHGWSPAHRHDLAPRQQGTVLNFTAPRIAAVSTTRERPAELEGKLDNLIPAHAATKADGEIVKRFARGRATQEILNSAPILAKDGSINPEVKAANVNSLPDRNVSDIRQTIAERESRIEELTKQREEVIANAVPEPEVSLPVPQVPPPTPGSGSVVLDTSSQETPDATKDLNPSGSGTPGNPLPGESADPVPTLPGQPANDPALATGKEKAGLEGLPGSSPGNNPSVSDSPIGGQSSGVKSAEARMEELKRRQEELLARSRNRNGFPSSGENPPLPVPSAVPGTEGPTTTPIGGNTIPLPSAGTGDQQNPSNVPSDSRNPRGRGEFVMPNQTYPVPLPGQTVGGAGNNEGKSLPGSNSASEAQARLAEQRANMIAEQNRQREEAMAAAAESQKKMQAQIQEAQQRAADQANAVGAPGRMQAQPFGQPQVGEPQPAQPSQTQTGQPDWLKARAAAAAEAQSKAQAEMLERSRAAAEAQSKMQAQLKEQQEKAAADAQNRMQAQQQAAQEQARAAAEAQSRMQAQLQEQARAATEARNQMIMQQQQAAEQARAAAEAQAKARMQQIQEQQARAAAQLQENMRAAQEARDAANTPPPGSQSPDSNPGTVVPGYPRGRAR